MSWADTGSANESASAAVAPRITERASKGAMTTPSVVVAVVTVTVRALGTAPEVARIVGAARALVNRRRRVRTQRPLSREGSGRIIARVLGGDDFRWRLAALHPALERAQQIVLRVHRRRRQPERAAESIRARAAAAVLHAGHHEQPEELLHFAERLAPRVAPPGGERHHALVVIDAVQRADGRIVPPVVQEDLPAAVLQRPQVRIDGVDEAPDAPLVESLVGVEVEREQVVG